jgi:hypothetical protein
MKKKTRKYTKKVNGKAKAVDATELDFSLMNWKHPKLFNLTKIKIEDGIPMPIRTQGAKEMFAKLDELKVGQSYRMPKELVNTYTHARNIHKRTTGKVFTMRYLDSYNFRCWRLEDETVLRTQRTKKKPVIIHTSTTKR